MYEKENLGSDAIMKNKYKNIGLNKVLEIITELFYENNSKSVNITSDLFSILGIDKYYLAKYDWVFFDENEQEEFDLEFQKVVLDNLKTIILDRGTDIAIRRELDTIIIKCISIKDDYGSMCETTIRCNNYITNTLIHQLVEKMYIENQENIMDDSESLINTIQSIYLFPIDACRNRIELSFTSKNNIFVKKIDITNTK